jgi:hypothetical protein
VKDLGISMKECIKKSMKSFYLTPVRMAIVKETTNAGEDARGWGRNFMHCPLVQPLWKSV